MVVPAKGAEPVLYVLPPSHFCERARWALQHAGIAFREQRLAVGPHAALARRIAPSTNLPILKLGNTIVQGSGAIVDWTGMERGDSEVEARFESRIGMLIRRYIYSRLLVTDDAGIRGLLLEGVPFWQKLVGTMTWPVVRKAMVEAMDIRPDLAPQMEEEISRELDWFEARLDDRPYLVGEAFGRADLTAASLLSPMIGSPGMQSRRRRSGDLFARFKDRPTLAWTRRMYADHRHLPMPRS